VNDTSIEDTQRMLSDSVRDYVQRGYGVAIRDASIAHQHGCTPARWAEFAELGWLALPLPEQDEGLGGSMAEICAVVEGMGRGLVNEPFVPCAVLGAGLLSDVATGSLRAHWLPRIAQGKARVACALWEPGAGFDHRAVSTTAQANANSVYLLQGAKALVPGGAGADAYLLAAALRPGTWGLFLVPADAPGLTATTRSWYDGQKAAELQMSAVPAADLLQVGSEADIVALLDRAVDRAVIAHCAESVGVMQGAFDTTLDYLKTRKQFGRVIAANQVVQHRMVDLMVEIEAARALTQAAAAVLDDPMSTSTARRRHTAAGRACVALAAKHVWQESVQLHGAIGMTQEGPVGQFVKRLATACTVYGSAESHLEALARLALDGPPALAA